MQITTNSILFSAGIIDIVMMACIPVTMMAKADQPTVDESYMTIQAIVTQTVYATTQTVPSSTSVPPTVTVSPATNTPVTTTTALPYQECSPM